MRAALVLVVALAGTARGNPADVYGLGSRGAGLAGAVAAEVDDFSAPYYNPAGLSLVRGRQAALGLMAAASNLKRSGERVPLDDPWRVVLGAAAPAPLGGPLAGRIHLGLALAIIPDTLLRVVAHRPEEPFYPYYQRTERLVVLPALSVRVHERAALGLAVNVLAALDGHIVTQEGPTRALEPRIEEEVPVHARLHAGARVAIAAPWTAALVWRQAFSVPFATTSSTQVAGEALDLDLRAEGLYTPEELVLGNAVALGATTALLDLTWSRWSTWDGPYVSVSSRLPLVGPVEGVTPDVPWKDTIGVRAGVEHAFRALTVRGGAAYETSPVPASQPGVTNLLDGPKYTLAGGVGWRRGAFAVDAHLMVQAVGSRTLNKRIGGDAAGGGFAGLRDEDDRAAGIQVSNPGWPRLSSGGQVLSAGVTVGFGL